MSKAVELNKIWDRTLIELAGEARSNLEVVEYESILGGMSSFPDLRPVHIWILILKEIEEKDYGEREVR